MSNLSKFIKLTFPILAFACASVVSAQDYYYEPSYSDYYNDYDSGYPGNEAGYGYYNESPLYDNLYQPLHDEDYSVNYESQANSEPEPETELWIRGYLVAGVRTETPTGDNNQSATLTEMQEIPVLLIACDSEQVTDQGIMNQGETTFQIRESGNYRIEVGNLRSLVFNSEEVEIGALKDLRRSQTNFRGVSECRYIDTLESRAKITVVAASRYDLGDFVGNPRRPELDKWDINALNSALNRFPGSIRMRIQQEHQDLCSMTDDPALCLQCLERSDPERCPQFEHVISMAQSFEYYLRQYDINGDDSLTANDRTEYVTHILDLPFGDFDGDRDVDGKDYGQFGLRFLRATTAGFFGGDYDGDGDVDGQDLGQFALNFLSTDFLFPHCGDGELQSERYEQCDDGNNLNGDGCNQYCFQEEAICYDNILPSVDAGAAIRTSGEIFGHPGTLGSFAYIMRNENSSLVSERRATIEFDLKGIIPYGANIASVDLNVTLSGSSQVAFLAYPGNNTVENDDFELSENVAATHSFAGRQVYQIKLDRLQIQDSVGRSGTNRSLGLLAVNSSSDAFNLVTMSTSESSEPPHLRICHYPVP